MADKIFHTGFNQKTNPVGADKVMISDSQASNETKYADLDNLPISTATQTALDTKVDNVIAGTNTTVSRSGNTITVNSLGGPAVVTDGFNRNYFVSTEGQTEFTANFDFTENTGSVIVALNGQMLKPTLDYTEPGLNKVVFVSGLTAGDEVQLLTGIKGEKGDTGNGISTITRTSGTGAPGTTDTYTITFTDSTTTTFQVYNGADGAGSGDVVGPASSTDNNIAVFNGVTGQLIKDGANTIAQVKDRANHTGTQPATTITNTPAGNISSTDIQGAINELDTEKVSLTGNETIAGNKSFTGNIGIGTTTPRTFNGTKLDILGNILLGNAWLEKAGGVTGLSLASNLYFDGGWKYFENRYGTRFSLRNDDGSIVFFTSGLNAGGGGASATLNERMRITNTGNVGIGTVSPTAILHLKAGTTTIAPLKLTAGVNLTTPQDGAIEYDGTHYYGTIGTTRFQLDQTLTTGTVTATGGQTVVTVGTYVIGNNKLQVFVNGLEQLLTTDYTETSTTSITFTSGLTAGDVVKYRILS